MTEAATAMQLVRHETRLPRPAGYDAEFWQVLCEVVFPHVSDPRAIVLAISYCRQRKLDILKRPVNIVPMWSSALRKEVPTIWPSIGETQITAARSGEWAGMEAPTFGDMQTEQFIGKRKDETEAKITLRFPEWCEVTVYRLIGGQPRAFTERVFWREAYGRLGGGALPNPTWQKRPIGMLSKVAKAASLRAAFPEENSSPTDDEMAGGIIDEATQAEQTSKPRPVIAEPVQPVDDMSKPAIYSKGAEQTWQEWGQGFIAFVRACSDIEFVDQWLAFNKPTLTMMLDEMPEMHTRLMKSIDKHKESLAEEN